jgi:SAM-dependent methyltransferase
MPIRIDDLNMCYCRCKECTYQFIWPRIPEERLLACYQSASEKNWMTDGSRAEEIRSYALKKQLLQVYAPGRRVLDFGCFDGGFLEYLGNEWDRFGVEPAVKAANIARNRGVRILGPSVDAIPPEFAGTMDAIVLFDVMEHLVDPVATLAGLRRLLVPDGIILIETGDCNSAHWRLIGRDYYYCAIVEHVGFFNKKSLDTAARRAELKLEHFRPSVHDSPFAPVSVLLSLPFVVLAYYLLRALRQMHAPLSPRLNAIAQGGSPAGFQRADHFLAVLRCNSLNPSNQVSDR